MTKTVVCTDIDGNEHRVGVDQLRWRPSVYAIVMTDSAVLVSPQFGAYDLPGGGIELGEQIEDALIREVKEETGIQVKVTKLVMARSNFFKLPASTKGVYIQSVMLYYQCEYVSGSLSDEAFMPDERIYNQFPEWLPLTKLDEITLVSERVKDGFDWRPIVKQLAEN